MGNLYYLAVFAVIMCIGVLLERRADGRTRLSALCGRIASLFAKKQ